MRWFRLFPPMVLASLLALGAGSLVRGADNDGNRAAPASATAVPPVLRPTEAADVTVLTLPGPAPKPAAPVAKPAPTAPPATVVRLAPPAPDPDRPVLRRPKPVYPDGFEKDSAEFLHQRLASFKETDARSLLGEPLRQRPAYDENRAVNGKVLAFADPTGRYKELELDFDKASGKLRTVFVYPIQMTWKDCRREFGANVTAAQANKGRTFYSYVNRHLDVLVDPMGKVISLGLY
ncbi:MAG TPA: hypothetical protein VLY04_02245 [Bryobacteraceae bacterium]|nr:hypothetical protein [Bryobacteraceae bacterium]